MRFAIRSNLVVAFASTLCICLANAVRGEVVFDGSLGPPGSLYGDMVIDDRFGQQIGSNLFHSFLTFNVNTGETATFVSGSPIPINNVIARVTGAGFSTVDGELGSTIPGASLWLVNPNGFLFGENATLNVSGSFHAASADYTALSDGGQFGADLFAAANTTLTVAEPSAFGFVDSMPAPIEIQESILRVNNHQSLSFVGGDISISGGPEGFLFAPGGDINLASVASAGEAMIGPAGIDISDFSAHGTIEIRDDGFLSVSESSGFDGAGSIYIRAGDLFVTQSSVFANTFTGDSGVIDFQASGNMAIVESAIGASSFDTGRTADISLLAGEDLSISLGSQVRTLTESGTTSNAGDIRIAATNIEISELSRVTSVTLGSGRGGDVTAFAAETLAIRDSQGFNPFATGLASESAAFFDVGNAGNVFVAANLLSIDAGVISSESTIFGFGDSGNIYVDVGRVEMTNEALITSSTRGFGAGGLVDIHATGSIDLTGFGTTIQSTTSGPGDSGPITITTPDLRMYEGAYVQAAPFSDGSGGDIVITVDRLLLSSSLISSGPLFTQADASSGDAGAITILAADSVVLENPLGNPLSRPGITTTTFGTGNAGPISITTPTLTVDDGSIDSFTLAGPFSPVVDAGDAGVIAIDVENLSVVNGGTIGSDTATDGAGGAIEMDVDELLVVSGMGSDISTSSLGPGNAGSIDIRAGSVLLENDGVISAFTAQNTGAGGSIAIAAGEVLLTDNGSIFAASVDSSGNAGNISVTADDLLMFGESDILTLSTASAGGNIIIRADNLVYVVDSRIESAAGGVTPNDSGGNISVANPAFLILNSAIVSASANAGNGGNIDMATDAFVASSDSIVTATSNTGIDGIITIESPNDVTGTVVELSAELFTVSEILADRCARPARRDRSMFVIESGAAPPRPDGFLSAYGSIASMADDPSPDSAGQAAGKLLVSLDADCTW